MTLLISHRGNIHGPTDRENMPLYIINAIALGYDVEIDVRYINNKLFLGHDTPDYEISIEWLLDNKSHLWIHTKNFAALSFLMDYDLRIFYHQMENHVIIHNSGLIWSHNLSEANGKSIIPLINIEDINKYNHIPVFGICSDYVDILEVK